MAYRKTEFIEKKRVAVRTKIIDAAEMLVNEGGWKNCTVTKVAKKANIATGSLYTHFSDITALHEEVYRAIGDQEISVLQDIAKSALSPLPCLQDAISAFTHRSLKGRIRAYAVIAEPAGDRLEILKQDYHRQFAEVFESILDKGQKQGSFAPLNSKIAATCILGCLTEALITPLDPRISFSADQEQELHHETLKFCLRAVGHSQT